MKAKCIKADEFGRLDVGKVYDLVPFHFIVWDGGNIVCGIGKEDFKEHFEFCDQASDLFRAKVSEVLYKVSQNPKAFESDPDYIVHQTAQELLALARKADEKSKEGLINTACKFLETALLSYGIDRNNVLLAVGDFSRTLKTEMK